uniref:Endo-1,5-alpha-L-arabinanase A n=1 Tax=Schizophyllum commune (strain H4-8 / FGSC 9210) TaxID=578458 RepID=D8QEP7_SCHCM
MNWAPDVALVNGQYVLYYSLPHSGFQSYSAVGLATSPSMKPGTWEDHGLIQHGNDASDGGNDTFHTSTFFSIDANLIETPSGLTLTYGSYLGGIFQRNMSSVHDVADPSKMPGKHLAGGGNRPCEGAFVYHKNDWFYLFVSYGITIVDPNHPVAKNREYHVTVGRSKSVSGPFLDKNGTDMVKVANGTVVLKTHDNVYVPGGQSIFLDPVSKRDVMVYHYVPHSNLSAPTNLGINFLDFASGWPVLVE